MDELYSTINIDELSHQSTWTSSTLLCTLTSSSHQSAWTSSTQLFTLTSSPISQHGRALLYYSFGRALPSVNMDELHSTMHFDELFPSVNMDELYSTIRSDELFPSVNMDELYTTIPSDELFPSVNMDELYSTIHNDELSHQSTWTSSTQLFTMTSSPISQHGRALLNYSV